VALDVAHLRLGAAGVARATRGVADALAARGDVELRRLGEGAEVPRGSAARKALVPALDGVWYPLLTRRAAQRAGADVHHCPAPRGPLARGRPPLVLTVHDLAALRHPETLSSWNRHYTTRLLPAMARAADRVTTPSTDTAADVQRLLGVPGGRIRVVPNGVDARFFGAARPTPTPAPYVLFVGTPEPRKNLVRLAAAVAALRATGRPERLVVAGSAGWGLPSTTFGPHVELLGRVTDDELHALYAGAACLAIPSLHEGFGLPAVEAMASGCPVVAARRGALPEVCGGAAVLVDPLDVESITTGLEQALEERDPLVALGRARARELTWEAAATRLVEVYRELV
jgi:glycosyltransferase involved in cell wall biosynthesis